MRPLATISILAASLLAAFAPANARAPGAEQILRKAEEIRNPDLEYAVDFTIHGVSRGEPVRERDASYSMLARGKDRTVILMRSPAQLYGALVLMADNRYWMLLPKATKPWELSGAQMMNGDVATGDLARANLTRGYTVGLSGEQAIEGDACWRLELQPESGTARYTRIVYWVAKKGFLPRMLEHYGRSGGLLKTVRYSDYRTGALGRRPMRIDIESFDEWKEGSTLAFANLRKLAVAPSSFTPDGMIAFRDAALFARDTAAADDVTLELILRAMASPPGLE
jgi:hypothetical protein